MNWEKIKRCKLVKVLGVTECENCKHHDECWKESNMRSEEMLERNKMIEQGMMEIARVLSKMDELTEKARAEKVRPKTIHEIILFLAGYTAALEELRQWIKEQERR